jgi:DNA polymerase III delta subunit
MPYLLLGSDDFSKKAFINSLVEKLSAELIIFGSDDLLPQVSDLSQTDLFSKSKVFWFNGIVPDFIANLPDLSKSKNRVVVSVKSLDKRKKENKELLTNEAFEVKEFLLPHAEELDKWIINRARELGAGLSRENASLLAQTLGRDSGKETKIAGKIISVEEIFSLWQVDSEIKKLLSFSDGKEITASNIRDLVSDNREVDVFEITNSIAEGKKAEAINFMHDFLKNQAGSEEKGAVIQLSALLAEQFRNVAMISGLLASKKTENEILELTGWKSGRLFVIKKISSRFELRKVLDFLSKLQALDRELKSSSIPPKVLLDLIVTQLF